MARTDPVLTSRLDPELMSFLDSFLTQWEMNRSQFVQMVLEKIKSGVDEMDPLVKEFLQTAYVERLERLGEVA
jgi:hypothetical protein